MEYLQKQARSLLVAKNVGVLDVGLVVRAADAIATILEAAGEERDG